MDERRQFPRLTIDDDAIALDEHGRELGRIREASGGGMLIQLAPGIETSAYKQGQHFFVTVYEPGSGTRHTFDVEVRYQEGDGLGVEFVSGLKS
jgi:hypothetical protein